jgi:DNA-binding transcriptional ArsR family regulator
LTDSGRYSKKVVQDGVLEKLEKPLKPDSLKPFSSENEAGKGWQLFTSHGLVLISILNNPGRTVKEISLELNLTERAVSLAIADLAAEGYLTKEKLGRRTFYHVNEAHPLKYPVSLYGRGQSPNLTVASLRTENLATHQNRPDETAQ